MAISDVTASSIAELVSSALEIGRGLGDGRSLWYRGIDNDEFSLLPKIMRDGKTETEVFERERRLSTRFRQRSMAYWPEGHPQSDWEHMFAMQHYGISTRLLDWSENLFVAAYFALSSASKESQGVPVIWCMEPVSWNRAMPGLSEYGESIQVLTTADEELEAYRPETSKRRSKSPVAMYGAHNSRRIVAQRGTFTVWGNDVGPMESFASPSSTSSSASPLLWRIKLTGNRIEHYRDLRALGFGETMIFPELASLAAELERTEGWR